MSVGSLRRRVGLAALGLAGLLAACAVPPVVDDGTVTASGAVATEPAKAAAASGAPAAQAPAAGSPAIGLRPLTRELAVPPGGRPASQVTAAIYDLSVPTPPDLPLDDGVPGDAPRLEELERGGASWYGIQFHKKRTASGERFDMAEMTAAHKTLPFGSFLCVRSLVNGREVMVRVNDRGPYAAGRVIDLSRAAADAIGMLGLGIKPVALSVVHAGQQCGGVVNTAKDAELSVIAAPASVQRKVAAKSARRPVAVSQRRR